MNPGVPGIPEDPGMEKRALSAKVRLLTGLGSPFLDLQIFLGRPDSHSRAPKMLICPHYRKLGHFSIWTKNVPAKNGQFFLGAPRPYNPTPKPPCPGLYISIYVYIFLYIFTSIHFYLFYIFFFFFSTSTHFCTLLF